MTYSNYRVLSLSGPYRWSLPLTVLHDGWKYGSGHHSNLLRAPTFDFNALTLTSGSYNIEKGDGKVFFQLADLCHT
jgi:hypothetical protein